MLDKMSRVGAIACLQDRGCDNSSKFYMSFCLEVGRKDVSRCFFVWAFLPVWVKIDEHL